jgi:hypothetical protein
MEKIQLFKEITGEIIKKKYPLYGKALVVKIGATGSISLSPSGEIVAFEGDPKWALECVLSVLKEMSGNIGVTSAITALKVFSMKHTELRADIDEVVNKFV